MNRYYKTYIEIDPHPEVQSGIEVEVFDASVVIETADEKLHDDLINAIAIVEALRRNSDVS